MLLGPQLEADTRFVVIAPVPAQDPLAAGPLNDKVVVPLTRLHRHDGDVIVQAIARKHPAKRCLRDGSQVPGRRGAHRLWASPRCTTSRAYARAPASPMRVAQSSGRPGVTRRAPRR